MKIRTSPLARRSRLSWLLWLSLALALGSTGCRSFLANQAMKNCPANIKPVDGLMKPNPYQEDLLYLKALGDEVVPLEDRYFPPDKRAAMEKEMLRDPKESREFRSWYLKKYGVEPPSRQLLPTPEQERPFFADVTDPSSPYYVPPDRPVFGGRIIVLVNENTGSAAAALAAVIQDNRLAVLVGTATANNPTGPTGFTPFTLPHSRIMVSLPADYVERAEPSNGEVMQPDYWVEDSIADIKAGRDAAFEKAQRLCCPE